ncbi:polysaccharide biosynthesis protein [Exiguobacterium sp. SH1S21]|uniref:polysaccharide biosynthesis protein n=1 Tax=Exiguobacterium sp. SH1S21 TaxID=2510953 RepID=UPI00103AC0EC|nr:polysaccharide biosynthesis protein [Exiguobacterium sp. SH1S21]TCI50781.1 polysaccharide biosynthesis protein [Exiguobacterium sp. SH1S21]
MRTPSKFATGVVLFALAGYISKFISFAYRVPYQNIAGDFGLYAYQTVYPFAAIVASLGIYAMPVVIAKIGVGAQGPRQKLEVLWGSFYALLGLAVGLVVAMFALAPVIARLLGDPELATTLRVISLSYLLMPALAVLRGSFQSIDDLRPSALSQVLENLIRVAVLLVSLLVGVRFGRDAYELSRYAYAATLVGGSVAVVVLSIWAKGFRIVAVRGTTLRAVLRVLLTSGLAVGFASLGILWMQLVDSFTIVNLMGGDYSAKVSKGVFDRGYPLVQFAILFTTALGMANVPNLVRHYRAGRLTATATGLSSMIRVTTTVAAAATIGLMGVMWPLNVALFENADGTRALVLLSTSTFAASLAVASMTCLQAIDKERTAAFGMLFAMIVKFAINLLLVPRYGIDGAAVGTSLAFLAMAAFNFNRLDQNIPLGTFRLHHYGLLLKTVLPMGIVLLGLNALASESLYNRVNALGWLGLMVVCGGALYVWRAVREQVLTIEEWEMIPFGNRLINLIDKKET